MGPSWGSLGPSWAPLGPSDSFLGPSWGYLGSNRALGAALGLRVSAAHDPSPMFRKAWSGTWGAKDVLTRAGWAALVFAKRVRSPWDLLGGLLESSWGLCGASWHGLAVSWGGTLELSVLGPPQGHVLSPSAVVMEALLEEPRKPESVPNLLNVYGRVLGSLWGLLWVSSGLLGASRRRIGASWRSLGASSNLLRVAIHTCRGPRGGDWQQEGVLQHR